MKILTSISLAAFLATGSQLTAAACSQSTLDGFYGASGTIANYDTGDLLNLVGRIRFNGSGGVSMPFVRFSTSGQQYASSGKGTYTLNASCTGSATLNFISNGNTFGTAKLQMVVAGTPDAPVIYAIYTGDGDASESGELVFSLIQH